MTNKYIIQNKLKYIFSNNNILLNSIDFCKKNNIEKKHLKYIIQSIDKFLACRDMSKDFIKFKCPLCPIIHKFPLTCKSKLCPSCGFKYARIWSQNAMKHILNIEHRHVLFTIPKECRQFFFYDRKLLSKLSEAVNKIFKFCFHNISKKNLRKNKENKRFFFNVGDGDINSTEGIIRYLGRYLARSPVAEYKITEIDDGKVTFFFNDLASNKKKTYITMPAEKFISQILIHLPPKNFKMVNRYGFYSRHISDELKKAMEPFRKNISVSKYSFYQRQMYITFGMNPFYCPECKVKMIVWEFYHYLYPPLKKYY